MRRETAIVFRSSIAEVNWLRGLIPVSPGWNASGMKVRNPPVSS